MLYRFMQKRNRYLIPEVKMKGQTGTRNLKNDRLMSVLSCIKKKREWVRGNYGTDWYCITLFKKETVRKKYKADNSLQFYFDNWTANACFSSEGIKREDSYLVSGILWHINPSILFYIKSCLCIYIYIYIYMCVCVCVCVCVCERGRESERERKRERERERETVCVWFVNG